MHCHVWLPRVAVFAAIISMAMQPSTYIHIYITTLWHVSLVLQHTIIVTCTTSILDIFKSWCSRSRSMTGIISSTTHVHTDCIYNWVQEMRTLRNWKYTLFRQISVPSRHNEMLYMSVRSWLNPLGLRYIKQCIHCPSKSVVSTKVRTHISGLLIFHITYHRVTHQTSRCDSYRCNYALHLQRSFGLTMVVAKEH